MELDAGWFNELLGEMGQAVAWRRAALCPCRDPYSGAAQQGCPHCAGLGWLWAEPVSAWTGLASMRVVKEWAAFGLWASGDVVLSVPSDSPLYSAGENDRVVMENSSEPFSIHLTREGDERVRFPMVQVDRVFWINPGSGELVEGGVPTVGADGVPTWSDPAAAPDPGIQYSITGRKRPEYFMFKELPQDRAHFAGAPLPRRMVLRRFDLFGSQSAT
ncbi:hypothetical protein [Azospirillum sp.]|uniref:hypothetical protein n=1 Tax=Azospirillum sp. TaxID=34012 RepID=UPI003D71CFB1